MTANGAMIMSVFAAIWWIVGARASGHGSPAMLGVAVALSAVLVAAAWARRGARPGAANDRRSGRVVGIASGIEGVAILIAVNVLANTGRTDLTAPVIAIIVGLHFLPLARWLPATLYYFTGALLVAIGCLGFAVSDVSTRVLLVSVGAALTLWLTSAVVLGMRRPPGRGEAGAAR